VLLNFPISNWCLRFPLCRWDYVVKHKVQLPDEYDQIYRDIEPFWALRPSDIKARQETWETFPGTYTISNEDGFIYLALHTMPEGDEDVAETRASDQIKLLREVQQWLPDFRATFTAHDVPYQFIGHDQLSEAREAAGMGECRHFAFCRLLSSDAY